MLIGENYEEDIITDEEDESDYETDDFDFIDDPDDDDEFETDTVL